MIVINLTIIIGEPVQVHRQPSDLNRSLLEALKPPPEAQAGLHHVSCTLCRDWEQWYHTAAKARQGLAGHQSWCRRRPSKHPIEGRA